MRKGDRQLALIMGVIAAGLMGYALWRQTLAAWIGIFILMAALASLVAVHWADRRDED